MLKTIPKENFFIPPEIEVVTKFPIAIEKAADQNRSDNLFFYGISINPNEAKTAILTFCDQLVIMEATIVKEEKLILRPNNCNFEYLRSITEIRKFLGSEIMDQIVNSECGQKLVKFKKPNLVNFADIIMIGLFLNLIPSNKVPLFPKKTYGLFTLYYHDAA